MPTYQITAPDGNTYRIDGPPGATDEQVRAEVLKQHPTAGTAKTKAAPKDERTLGQKISSEAAGALEAGASIASSVPAGLGGGLTYLGALAATRDPAAASAVKSATEEALTYQPRGVTGRADVRAAGNVANTLIEKPTEAAGDLARRGAQGLGASPEVAGAVGATVKTAGQALPYAAGIRGVKDVLHPHVRAVGEAIDRSSRVTGSAPGEAVARDYVTRNTGLDWNGLPDAVKGTLSRMAARGEDLGRLDPRAIERVARAQSLDVPVPVTRAQATRDLADITEEENLRRTHAGAPLRDKMSQQDTALHRNLAAVREQVAPGSKVTSSADAGLPVQAAARRKLQVMKAQSRRLYKQAEEAGDMQAPVKPDAITEWLKDPANKANAGWIEGRIKAYSNPDGTISINNLEKLRQEANAKTQEQGTAGHYAGQAKGVIDQLLDGAGGEAYQKARASWREWNQEFGRQRAIRDLTSEKAGLADRRIALEGTTDYVLKSSRESLQEIKDTLLTGGTDKTRLRGEKAWRDLQAGVIQKLREEAAGKRQIRNEQDAEQFNATFLDRFGELDRSGKLEVLFGKQAAAKLRKIADTARDVRTTPADRVSGPNTSSRLMAAMETFAHSTGLSFVARGARAVVEKAREGERAERAASNPLEDATARERRIERQERKGAAAGRLLRDAAPYAGQAAAGAALVDQQ